jgi:hypothetical protein
VVKVCLAFRVFEMPGQLRLRALQDEWVIKNQTLMNRCGIHAPCQGMRLMQML